MTGLSKKQEGQDWNKIALNEIDIQSAQVIIKTRLSYLESSLYIFKLGNSIL